MSEIVSARTACLFDSHVECGRVWVAQGDGLHAVYFHAEDRTDDPQHKEIPRDPLCRQCARNDVRLM